MINDNPTGNEPINMAEAASLLLDRQESEDNPQPNQEAQPESEVEETPDVTDTEELVSEEPDEALEATEEDVSEESDEEITEETEEFEEQEYYTVKNNGVEEDVTLDELVAGYSRQSDYTKKTTDLANQRKEFEQQKEALLQERNALAQGLQQLNQKLSNEIQNEPTKEYWDNLYNTDPLEFIKQKDDYRDKQLELQKVQQAQNQLQQQQAAEQQQQMQKHLAAEQEKLVKAIPEWKDEKVAEIDKRNIVTFAKRYGFNDQELNNATDHRAILMLRMAMMYDALESKKPLVKKKLKKAPKMTKSSKKLSTQKSLNKTKVDKAYNKLKSTGSMDSAVDYLLQKSN
tara:strand:+ start:9405 stop:10436 length:1032 start_codon:yes stop_codon:yes gene_type:complete